VEKAVPLLSVGKAFVKVKVLINYLVVIDAIFSIGLCARVRMPTGVKKPRLFE